jgi:hypothetical protein
MDSGTVDHWQPNATGTFMEYLYRNINIVRTCKEKKSWDYGVGSDMPIKKFIRRLC